MTSFSPLLGACGGSIIGLAAGTLLLGSGHILGVSGIVSSVITDPSASFREHSQGWKVAFVASFLAAVRSFVTMKQTFSAFDTTQWMDSTTSMYSPAECALAGLLVGVGTKLGNGCTTGHGICGMARLSKRSIAAVLSFMVAAMLSASMSSENRRTRYEEHHMQQASPSEASTAIARIICLFFVAVTFYALLRSRSLHQCHEKTDGERNVDEEINNQRKMGPAVVSGCLLAVGIVVGGMQKPSKVFGFFDVTNFSRGTYDPTLMFVFGGGLLVSFLSYEFVPGYGLFKRSMKFPSPPLLRQSCASFCLPARQNIDAELIVGEIIFGIGLGLGGLCPGPAMALAAAGFPQVLFYWWPSFIVGSVVGRTIQNKRRTKG